MSHVFNHSFSHLFGETSRHNYIAFRVSSASNAAEEKRRGDKHGVPEVTLVAEAITLHDATPKAPSSSLNFSVLAALP